MNDLSKVLALCVAIALAGCAEDDPQQFISEGKAFFEKGELKSARVQFKNAIQINPRLAEAYYGLALLDERKKDWPVMRRNLMETVRLDANHLDAQVKLGFMLVSELGKAKEKLAVVLKLAPNDLGVILLNGAVKYKDGDNVGAKKLVEKVLAKDEANVDAIRLLVSMLTNEKDYGEALRIIDRGIQKRPNNLDLLLLKISKLTDLKKYDEVISAYDDLVAKFPRDKALRQSQVNVLIRIGKPELIEKALREAVSSYPAEISFKLALIGHMRNVGGGSGRETIKEVY